MTDDRLRELYARAVARSANLAGPGWGQCLQPEQLLRLARREGTEDEMLHTLDHVMACEACRQEFDLLRAIEQAGAELGTAGRTRQRLPWRRLAPLALAASLLVAVGVVLEIRRAGNSTDLPRGGEEAVVLVAPPERVAGNQPVAFVWRPVSDARQYAFELLAAGPGGAVTKAIARTTSDTTVVLQPAQLRQGQKYQWWVRALTPAGELASPVRPLRVRSE